MKILTASLFLIIHLTSGEDQLRYDGYKVFRVTPKTEQAAETLRSYEKNSDVFDFWTRHFEKDVPVDVMIGPDVARNFSGLLVNGQFDAEVFIDNVQALVDQEQPKTRVTGFDWTSYHKLDEINEWLEDLAGQYPGQVHLIEGGTSYLGKKILGVHLIFNPLSSRKVFVESNIHAREWITSAVTTWFINHLVTSQDQAVVDLRDSRQWYIFPVVNPDGFVYSHERNRMWRKTRVPHGAGYGADPNRNWGYEYYGSGSSINVNSETYRGPYPFSEPEMKSLSEYISSNFADGLEAFISIHSYGQLLLLPYGYTDAHLENYDELREVGLEAIRQLYRVHGTAYNIGNIPEILYAVNGGSLDWVKYNIKPRICYSYELRDQGQYGFILPADQIIPTAEETWASFFTIFQQFDRIYADAEAAAQP